MDTDKDELLRSMYYNKDSVGYLASAKTLHKLTKESGKKYTLKYVSEFLKKQEVNQILSNKQDVFYPPILAEGNYEYQCDLTFFDQYKRQNSGYGIIMAFIEITTRKAFCYPLKNKTAASICEAYKLFLNDVNYKINKLTSDLGSEFISKEFEKLDTEHNIIHYFPDAGDKTSVGKIERFNKTIRGRITKHQKANKTLNWIDVLDELVKNYNNTVHSSIDLAPNEVNDEDAEEIRNAGRVKRDHAVEIINTFNVGDKVRLLKKKKVFDKGGSTYTKSIYTIHEIDKLALILKDKNNNILDRRIKPYNVKLIDEVETAPQDDTIEKHSNKQNNKLNKFVNRQNRESAFDLVDDNTGQVQLSKKLIPVKEKRVDDNNKIVVNDRVSSIFNMPDKSQQVFEGVILKVNPKTYDVLFDDGDKLRLKKNEVKLIDDVKNVKEKPKETKKNDDYIIYQNGDKVKALFNNEGVEEYYFGSVVKYLPKTQRYKVLFEDGDLLYMRENELVKLIG
jgi:hypothetical protein